MHRVQCERGLYLAKMGLMGLQFTQLLISIWPGRMRAVAGYVFKLFIDQNTPIANYSQVPGETVEAKRSIVLGTGGGLSMKSNSRCFFVLDILAFR